MGGWRTHRRRSFPAPAAESSRAGAAETAETEPTNAAAAAPGEEAKATAKARAVHGSATPEQTNDTAGGGQPCTVESTKGNNAGSAAERWDGENDDAALLQPQDPPSQQKQHVSQQQQQQHQPQLKSTEQGHIDVLGPQRQLPEGGCERIARVCEARCGTEELLQQQLLQQQLLQQQLLQQQQLIQQQLLLSMQQRDSRHVSQASQMLPLQQFKLPTDADPTLQSAQMQQEHTQQSKQEHQFQQPQLQRVMPTRKSQVAQKLATENAASNGDANSCLLHIIPFKVVYCSSFEPPHNPEKLLLTQSKDTGERIAQVTQNSQQKCTGWSSAPNCAYPQEIGFAADGIYHLKLFQLLAHECRIPLATELGIVALSCLGVPADRESARLPVACALSWKSPAAARSKLAHSSCCTRSHALQHSSNGGAVLEQWEKNTPEQQNKSLLAREFHQRRNAVEEEEGHAVKLRLSAFLEEQVELLHLAKKNFVEEELFCAALRVREALEKLEHAKPRVIELENQKDAAAAREDFEEAASLKKKLFGAQLCIKTMVAAALQVARNEGALYDAELEGEKLLREGLVACFQEEDVHPPAARPASRALVLGDVPLQGLESSSETALQCSTDSFPLLRQQQQETQQRQHQQQLLDDRPIRGMRSHAFPPERPEPSASHEADESELPEVEDLLPEDTKDASLLLPFLSTAVVRCLFSSQAQARCAAHEIAVKQLQAHTGGVSGELFVALCVLLRRAFRDKVLKVFLAGSQILTNLMEEQGLQPRYYLSPPFKVVMHELLLRVADVTSERAKKLLFQLSCHRPETKDEIAREVYERIVASYPRLTLPPAAAGNVGATGVLSHATAAGAAGSKGGGNSTTNAGPPSSLPTAAATGATAAATAAQQHKSVAQLVQLLDDLLSTHVIVQPLSPTGLELPSLLNLLAALFQSHSADIRGATVRLSARLLSLPHAPTQTDVQRFIDTLRPKQRELVNNEFKRLTQLMQQPVNNSGSTTKSPVNVEAEDASLANTDNKSPAQTLPDPTCEFCLKQSSEFSVAGLERHFLLKCPMLAPCPHCMSVVEVAHMWDHFLLECPQTSAYVRCETCCSTMLKTQLYSHKQQSCKAAPTRDHRQCYFCREVLPPVGRGWRQHLLHECPNNPRAPQLQTS